MTPRALIVIQDAIAGAFLLLALATFRAWLQHRGTGRSYLAWAVGLLAITSLAGRFNVHTDYATADAVALFSLPAFMASGYAFLCFRAAFVPLSRVARLSALGAVVLASVAALVVRVPSRPGAALTSLQFSVVVFAIGVWSVCVMEPVVRLWLASRGRARVERARLRTLSAGYASIVVILLVAVGAGPSAATNAVFQLVLGAASVVIIPLLYASFVPPRWLRRIWRWGEEGALRKATAQLILFAPNRSVLAEHALDWALRLVGADAGFVTDPDGEPLALRGMSRETAQVLAARVEPGAGAQIAASAIPGDRAAVLVPLRQPGGIGVLAAISGPFTPLFGSEELDRLGEYAISITAGLERSGLMASLAEQAQSSLRARAEAERAAMELRRSNAALEEFAYVASHDLQEPLRMVASYLELLERRYGAGFDDDAREFIGYTIEGACRMQALIDDLLTYARVGTEGGAPHPVDSGQALTHALANLRTTIAESGAVITRDPLPPVLADETHLMEVFQNLVSNSVKFRGEGPPRVHISAERSNGECVFSVTDQGIGIDPGHTGRIFKIFNRLNPRSEYEGTGIGLSICRRVVEHYGGHIWVISSRGEGSMFRFTLPAADDVTVELARLEPAPVSALGAA